MLYITKFHARLHQATRQTVVAVSTGDVSTALSTAPTMTAETLQLAQEALQKAGTVFISANEEIYLRMSQMAYAFAEAGMAMAQSNNGDGTFSEEQYQEGVFRLSQALENLD